jgi:hypothetical protein
MCCLIRRKEAKNLSGVLSSDTKFVSGVKEIEQKNSAAPQQTKNNQ